jgi:hypothetical protein
MRRSRERLRKTLLRSRFGVEDLGLPGFAFVHDTRVFEFLDEGFFASVREGVSALVINKER